MEALLLSLTKIIKTELSSVIDVSEINFNSQLNNYLTSDTDNYLKMNRHQLLQECTKHSLNLYKLVKKCLADYFTACIQGLKIPTQGFLQIYIIYFNEIFAAAKTFASTFSYLNMIWEKSLKDGQLDTSYNISQILIGAFSENYFIPLNEIIKKEVFQIISNHRDKKTDNIEIVRDYCEHLYKLSFARTQAFDLAILPTDYIFYNVYFENDFLIQTIDYYKPFQTKFNNTSDQQYIELVSSILEEEDNRIKTHFHQKTSQIIIKSLGETLINWRRKTFIKEFENMLLVVNSSNNCCQQICIKMKGKCDLFREIFSTCFEKEISVIFCSEIYKTDILLFFNSCKDCVEKYKKLLLHLFNGSFILKKQLDTAMSEALYKSIEKEKLDFSLFSKLLAEYTSIHLLRRTEKSRARNKLNNFTFIRDLVLLLVDKKEFINSSFELFKMRFLQNKSISIEYENDFISLIDDVSKGQGTEKFKKILDDYIFNYKIMNNLIRSMPQDKYIENIKILTKFNSVQYPIKIFKSYEHDLYDKKIQEIPTRFDFLTQSFESSYKESFPKSNYHWLANESSVKMNMKFKDKSYSIYASLTQAAILSLFNDKSSYTVSEIVEKTGVNITDVSFAISLLIEKKLLKKASQDSGDSRGGKIELIEYNQLFESEFSKINVRKLDTVKVELKNKNSTPNASINTEYIIKPVIAKYVKLNGPCEKNKIIEYILDKKNKFPPTTKKMIETCLERLVKTGRIKISGSNKDIYSYANVV